MTINTPYQLIRRLEVLALTARPKSALQLDEKASLFCPSISIGDRAVAYNQHEEQSPEQIKQLVQNLIQQRKKAA